jgi:GNAT superfamily N-acetyltransferase
MNVEISKNIHNLTSIWRIVGEHFESFYTKSNFHYAIAENSQWPNRIWFTQEVTPQAILEAKEQIAMLQHKMVLPVWLNDETDIQSEFESTGFKLVFSQVGMSLSSPKPQEVNGTLVLKKVSTAEQARAWSLAFSSSFGYVIGAEVIYTTCNSLDYYLVLENNAVLGTVLLHESDGVCGVHAMGVTPNFRRKGQGREIMKHAINKAIDRECNLVTLQASDMGKPLYLDMGFKEQFTMNNYALI